MSELLIEEINGIPVYFTETKPVKKFFNGRHVVFHDKKNNVYYYVREKPGHVKTGNKYSGMYDMKHEVPELTEYFSVTEDIFSGTVLNGDKLMILIKGPEVNYIKALLLEETKDPETNWDREEQFIGFVTPKESSKRMYMFKTSAAKLVKIDDN
tara:strand:- start:1249 stop:1710 length:462 start_codon:yes stop_codon:yes gene_type:complete